MLRLLAENLVGQIAKLQSERFFVLFAFLPFGFALFLRLATHGGDFRLGRSFQRSQFGRHAGVLCFVEVKTRSTRAIAPPREAVTTAKRRKLRDAAGCYLAETGWDGPCRFDVAEVYPADSGGRRQINYITSAF